MWGAHLSELRPQSLVDLGEGLQALLELGPGPDVEQQRRALLHLGPAVGHAQQGHGLVLLPGLLQEDPLEGEVPPRARARAAPPPPEQLTPQGRP